MFPCEFSSSSFLEVLQMEIIYLFWEIMFLIPVY